mgnify:CR=1 FL=1
MELPSPTVNAAGRAIDIAVPGVRKRVRALEKLRRALTR